MSVAPVGPIACAEQDSEYGCAGWYPPAEVDYNTGTNTYLLDLAFVRGLIADPEPLWACDDATVLLGKSGFEVADADSGELLYELGLRNGDVIVSLNGMELNTVTDVGAAFSELWSTRGETTYVLEIKRESSPLKLNYRAYVTGR